MSITTIKPYKQFKNRVMSEIIERTNIISIAEIPAQNIHASMVKLNEMSSYQPLNIVLSNMSSYIQSDVMNAIQLTTGTLNFTTVKTSIKSPNILRTSFSNNFSPTLTKMEAKGINSIVARKATFLNTLTKMDFKIKQSEAISSNLKVVFQTNDLKTLNAEIKTVMNKLEKVHTDIFAQNIATACATASRNIGFKEVEIKTVQGKLEVIASNNLGQHILSEINFDSKTNQVNANTETIGITDGSCKSTINQFNEELKKLNIKIGNEKSTFTGGVCQMSYAKIIDMQDKESKKQKEIDRTRKLNNYKQLKN